MELKWLERVRQSTHDGATRTTCGCFVKSYKIVVKSAKKDFHAVSFASVNSRLTQLFRTIWTVTSLLQGKQSDKELAIGCKAFVKY